MCVVNLSLEDNKKYNNVEMKELIEKASNIINLLNNRYINN